MNDVAHLRLVLGQMIRFGAVGLFSTFVYSIVYWPLAQFVMSPMLAVPIAFGVAVMIGYPLHSKWSFKGHGNEERPPRTQALFVFVQSLGFLLNLGFTWLLTHQLGGPAWWPLVPAVLVTPAVTFGLNRWWVFA